MRVMSDNGSWGRGLAPVQRISVHVAAGAARLDRTPGQVPVGGWRAWLLPLGVDDTVLAALWQLLAEDERRRADTFRVSWARCQFVHVRGVLRLLLGECRGGSPADISFDYGEFGKPMLAQDNGWQFNVAHSGDYALLVVANGPAVGVDIERLRALDDLASLAPRVLSPGETVLWQSLSASHRQRAFFAAWTGKEAVVKAMGRGLQMKFSELDIGWQCLGRDAGAREVVAGCFGRCRLVSLPVPCGYVAALAVREAG